MNLQFADLDADGHQDIVTATFEGHVFVVRGKEDGWHAPEHVLDAQGRKIALSLYYDMEANKYDNVDRSPEGKRNPEDHCVSAVVMDWDADGDLDLLLGAKEGRLYLQRNEGTAKESKFTGVNELLTAGGKEFSVPGGLTAAKIVDWDGDGLDDLVCGSFDGGATLYRNTGASNAPSFAAPVVLHAAAKASPAGENGPTSDWYVDVLDYDADGQLDLVVGGHYQHQPEQPDLSAEQEARLAELEKEQSELSEEFSELFRKHAEEIGDLDEEAQEAANDAFYESDEYRSFSERMSAIYGEISELRPPAKRVSGVWLYRGLAAG
ncbi:MAG: FG-GAP-like repeat-containing protein [Planctomycetota bacterium]